MLKIAGFWYICRYFVNEFRKKKYMKTLFRGIISVIVSAIVCTSVLSSCTDNEDYDLGFDLPGQIVTEFGATIVVPFKSRNIASVTVNSVPKGWTVEKVDLINRTITIKAPGSFADDSNKIEENGLLKMRGYTPDGTSLLATSYLSLLNQHIDLSDEYSNCYVVTEKNTRYTIDLTHKGESSEVIKPYGAYIAWQTSSDLLNYSSFDAETGKFTFFVGNEEIKDANDKVVDTRIPDGNALVIAYDEDANTLWSWHVWVTGSDIEATAIETSVGTFMDRNLGAYHNSKGSVKHEDIYRSYGLYYQWGRKDPFVRPIDYKFSGDNDQIVYNYNGSKVKFLYMSEEDNEDVGTEAYAHENPMSFVLGSKNNAYDWIYASHNDNLWTAGQKSLSDPCPRGWRVPDGDVFAAFDIDEAEDLAALANVRDMYGWHIVDKATGVKMFMPGAGRRSFETGALTNMNNYGYENVPMPWIGYYWTAGVGVDDKVKARSMFFDLNTTRAVNNRYEPTKEMYRANAMQVRCVRE